MQTFTIPGKLPSLNDVIDANREDPRAGARLKHNVQSGICWAIRAARLKPITSPVHVEIAWHEPHRRRDPDNIYSAVKFILDALVETGVLDGDGQRHVLGIANQHHVDKFDPRIVVTIREGDQK